VHDPRTIILTVTNIVLGVAVVLLVLGVITGSLCDVVSQWKKRRFISSELDRDMRELLAAPPPKCDGDTGAMKLPQSPKSTRSNLP